MTRDTIRSIMIVLIAVLLAAGVTDKLWGLEDMAALLERQAPAKRGPYKKKAA